MTLIKDAKDGIITNKMKIVAQDEKTDPEFIRKEIAEGLSLSHKTPNASFSL